MSLPKHKILIIDDLHPCFFEQEGISRFDINYQPDMKPEAVAAALVDVDILIVRGKVKVDAELCRNANKLKLVARAGAGMDNLDMEWLNSQGVICINAGGANSQAVAEQTLGMLLNLLANITKADREVRNMIWDREGNRGEELNGKTIGIIGYGNTGSAFAGVLRGFDVSILAYDKYLTGFGNDQVKESDMTQIFKEADILSLHIPLTSETRQLVCKNYIDQFSKPLRLLNLSRGEIVCTKDVLEALVNGQLRGFAADVLENEKINLLQGEELMLFNKLVSLSNVILTPHIGGWSNTSYRNISEKIATGILSNFEIFIPPETGFKEAQKFP
jgi:D-3-phosphoglycerate dehydrogenase